MIAAIKVSFAIIFYFFIDYSKLKLLKNKKLSTLKNMKNLFNFPIITLNSHIILIFQY